MKVFSPYSVRFFGWLALLQILAVLAGLEVIFLFPNFFSDSPEFFIYGWATLPLWFLWGFWTPRFLRSAEGTVWVLVLWMTLLIVLDLLLPDYQMLLTVPQLAAGRALAQLWPGNHHGARFLWTVEPIAQMIAHALLPTLLGLGLRLGGRRKE